MRKLVKLIKKDANIALELIALLGAKAYNIIQQSAMSSKTLFHEARRYAADYRDADPRITEIFAKIRYNYSKKWMEMFF